MGPYQILTSVNGPLAVTNLVALGSPTPGGQTYSKPPLGTVNGSATGELGMKVVLAGSTTTAGGVIPVSDANTVKSSAGNYVTIAASQTDVKLGATGAIGDYLQGILVIPTSVDAGNVVILDGATSITVFAGGSASTSNLVPFYIPLGIKSVSGAWHVTTGSNISVIAIGSFT